MTTVKLHSLHIVFRFHPREWKLTAIWDHEEKGIMFLFVSICFATEYRISGPVPGDENFEPLYGPTQPIVEPTHVKIDGILIILR